VIKIIGEQNLARLGAGGQGKRKEQNDRFHARGVSVPSCRIL
jgi:hypothetical protein